jgi:hypothetical protein
VIETDERRSTTDTTGFACVLSGGAVDWNSRLQQTVAVSTCVAEYQVAGAAVRATLWWRKLLPEVGVQTDVVDMKGDNQSIVVDEGNFTSLENYNEIIDMNV